jgi:hypothetical protein
MEDNPMQAWTMFQHYMAAKIEAAKNVWERCGPINNAVKAMSIPNLVAKPLSYMLKRRKRYGSHHSYELSQVQCSTRSELTHQLLSILFHHQDTPQCLKTFSSTYATEVLASLMNLSKN